MKKLSTSAICFILAIGAALGETQEWWDSYRKNETEQVDFWRENLIQSRQMDTPEKFEFLWIGLKNMGIRIHWENHSPSVDNLYHDIQDEYLSTPGHAIYFSGEIESQRKKTTENPGHSIDYDRKREWYIKEALIHLPSPETIAVLGHYLDDDRDPTPPYVPGQDWFSPPANSGYASIALAGIGLVDPPANNLKAQREWYAEVKSGQRSFAFAGKGVSYRFKADGSVETTPRDASRDRKQVTQISPAEKTVEDKGPWLFIGIGAGLLAILLIIARSIRRKFTKKRK